MADRRVTGGRHLLRVGENASAERDHARAGLARAVCRLRAVRLVHLSRALTLHLESSVHFSRGLLMEIINVGVIGAGTMGNGIAHVFAKTGYNVTLCDLKPEYIDRAIGFISKNLQREVDKQKIPADARDAALGRIKGCTDRTEMRNMDF